MPHTTNARWRHSAPPTECRERADQPWQANRGSTAHRSAEPPNSETPADAVDGGATTGEGYVRARDGAYSDGIAKGHQVIALISESLGGIAPDARKLLIALDKLASTDGHRDGTKYGLARTTTRSFHAYHLCAISTAIVTTHAEILLQAADARVGAPRRRRRARAPRNAWAAPAAHAVARARAREAGRVGEERDAQVRRGRAIDMAPQRHAEKRYTHIPTHFRSYAFLEKEISGGRSDTSSGEFSSK